MAELAGERIAARKAFELLQMDAWIYERDAGARSQSIEQTYLDELEESDLYVGVFWLGYGEYTVEEFEHARMLGKDCLIYEKRTDVAGKRDPRLQQFLDRLGGVRTGLTVRWFESEAELVSGLKDDVTRWLALALRSTVAEAPHVCVGLPDIPGDVVGRDTLIGALVKRLRQGESLAIDGLPGVGKSTLAAALAAHPGVRRHFRDGVLWGSLGPDGDAMALLAGWGEAIKPGLGDGAGGQARAQALRDAIGARRFLLVVDDLWDASLLPWLRCGGPQCAYLFTTRDKAVARAAAGAAQVVTVEALDDADACAMLRGLAPEALGEQPAITRHLAVAAGGLPLMLTLIGGYLAEPAHGMYADLFPDLAQESLARMMDPARRLQLTTTRLGQAPDARFSLQQVLDLSFEGLPPSARAAFDALGAFAAKPASFDREAAEAVTRAPAAVLALLAARNLVEVNPQGRRFALHQVLADAARRHTDAAALERHRAYYFGLIQDSEAAWVRMAGEYEQLRHAWLAATLDEMRPNVLRMESFWMRRGLWRDQIDWYERLLRQAEPADRAGVAIIKGRIGLTYRFNGMPHEAISPLDDARRVLEELGEPAGVQLAEVLTTLAVACYDIGETARGFELLDQCLSVCRRWGLRPAEVDCLLLEANLRRKQGDQDRALALLNDALPIAAGLERPALVADNHLLLGMTHRSRGDFAAARAELNCALEIVVGLGAQSSQAEVHRALARVEEDDGHPAVALACLQRAIELWRASGVWPEEAHALLDQADLLGEMAHYDESRARYSESIEIYRAIGQYTREAEALCRLARLSLRQERFDEARDVALCALDHWRAASRADETIDTLILLSLIDARVGRDEDALERAQQALRVLEMAKADAASPESPLPQARVFDAIGCRFHALGEFDQAIEAFLRAKACVSAGDSSVSAETLDHRLARVRDDADALRVETEIEATQQRLEAARRTGDISEAAEAALRLGNLALDGRRPEDAERMLLDALECWSKIGDKRGVARATHNLGLVSEERGDVAEALRLLHDAADRAREASEPQLERTCRYNAARILANCGRCAEAIADWERVVQLDSMTAHPDLETDRATLDELRTAVREQGEASAQQAACDGPAA